MLNNKNTPIEYPLVIIEQKTINTSGKNEGIGGIPALETNSKPKTKTSQKRLLSILDRVPNREEIEWLTVPANRNIPIAAQP